VRTTLAAARTRLKSGEFLTRERAPDPRTAPVLASRAGAVIASLALA